MPVLRYTDPRSSQTLREGIMEARQAEGVDDAASTVAHDLAEDIDAHDAIHVLFGCSTDLRGEILAHVWTMVGTTTTMRDMSRVTRHADHRSALSKVGHFRLFRAWLRSLPAIAITVVRALRMHRQWPVSAYRADLDRPLQELRDEYGIRLPKGGQGGRGAGALLRHEVGRPSR